MDYSSVPPKPERTGPERVVDVSALILPDLNALSADINGKPFDDKLSLEEARGVIDCIVMCATRGRVTEEDRVVVDSELDGPDAFRGACQQDVNQRFLRPSDERLTVHIVKYRTVAATGLARYIRPKKPALERYIVSTYKY